MSPITDIDRIHFIDIGNMGAGRRARGMEFLNMDMCPMDNDEDMMDLMDSREMKGKMEDGFEKIMTECEKEVIYYIQLNQS